MGEAKRRKVMLGRRYGVCVGKGISVDISSVEGLINFAKNHIPSLVITEALKFCWEIDCLDHEIPPKYCIWKNRWLDAVLWWNSSLESDFLFEFTNSDFCRKVFPDKKENEILSIVTKAMALLIHQKIYERWKELDGDG